VKCLIDALVPTDKYEIFFVTRSFDPAYIPKGYRIIKVPGNSRRSLRRIFFDVRRLSRILTQIRPDVIYQRVGCAHTGIGALYAKNSGCKMVWHIAHDMEVIPYQFKPWRTIILRYVDKKFLEYGIKNSKHIIAQTENQAELLQAYYKRSPTSIIYNFHPFPKEEIKKFPPVKIVWVANLKPWKRPEVFIRLAKDLQGERGVQFIMVGALQGTKSWHKRLFRDIKGLKDLKYLGARTQEEVNSILASSHIFVNTSRWEGFPNTFIQSWMRKVPVVSLNVNPDGIFDDQDIGFHSRTYETLKKDVLTLIRNPDLREQMGTKAQTYAFSMHSQKNAEKIIEIFDSY
jgi:glycosyltransferase involved in cell wall biosynthesis